MHLPRSRSAIIATGVVGGLVLVGGGIATGTAISGSARPAAVTTPAATGTRAPSRSPAAAGPAELVTAVTGTSVTVDTEQGVRTYGLTGTTTYREGRSRVSSSALRPGEEVRIRIVPGTASAPVAQSVVIASTAAATPSTTA